MEFLIVDILLAVVLFLLVVYVMTMIGLMSGQTQTVSGAEKDVNDKRLIVKTKYNIA